MSHEITITVQLDPDTYVEVASGGRWFNIPSVHPNTGQRMTQEEAIEFATERGYLGLGFRSVERAVRSAGKRSSEHIEDPEGLQAGEFTPSSGYSIPFNPGGRAPDGFMYPEIDRKLLQDAAGEPTPTPPTPVAPPLDEGVEPLIGGF